ncbi:MAG: molybdopterin molybdotransferase MoeA [Thermodesulfobacteriota bacterium]
MEKSLPIPDLDGAMALIREKVLPLETEQVTLEHAAGRVAAENLDGLQPIPDFDQSTRDGFAPATEGPFEETSGLVRFRIRGEIAAGDTRNHTVAQGDCLRIMTGAMLPEGADRVVPWERCRVSGEFLELFSDELEGGEHFVRRRGSELKQGSLLLGGGKVISPEHQVHLAAAGNERVAVVRRPGVACFCTGSELVRSGQPVQPGQKVSGNRFLLTGLGRRFGGIPEDLGVIPDTAGELDSCFQKLAQQNNDLVVSTGGMGPGKYDLLEESFVRAGGEVWFRALMLRPGKSILFGRLGKSFFIGLPGPPPAVRTLFNELVGPLLLRLQGVERTYPRVVTAHLSQKLRRKKTGVMMFSGGQLFFKDGRCLVRPASKMEVPDCLIVIPAHRKSFKPGSRVSVHLVSAPFSPALS